MSEQQPQDIKTLIRQEYIKCASDPVYFMKKYYWIQHPTRGRTQFNLYPFQEKVLNLFQDNSYNIVNKSRQLGISTLVGAYTLWMMLFQKDKNILCIATKQETAKNLVTKVKFGYENLPSWLKLKAIENNKLSLKLANGSQIKAVSAASDSGRSEAVSLLIIDEAAFIDNIEEIFASAQQTLATGGGCIAISTPYGTGNWFHKTWIKAEAKDNSFLPIRLPWTVHPERDQRWRDTQTSDLGPRLAAQECDCDFSTSGDTAIEPEILNWYIETYQKDPIERRGIDGNYWIWEHPDFSRTYVVTADVARGDGKDFSAFHVIDVDSNTQVAEYKGQLGTRDYGNFLVGVAVEYNDALLVIENATYGWDVIQTAIDRGYRNLYYSPKSDTALTNVEMYLDRYENGNGMVPGFTNSLRTRPLVISKLISYIHERSVTIQSKRLLEEFRTFIWKNGKAQSMDGYNDDLVLSFGFAMFLRDTSLRFKQTGIDLARASLNSISSGYMPVMSNNHTPHNVHNDPWTMDDGMGGKENLNWLIG